MLLGFGGERADRPPRRDESRRRERRRDDQGAVVEIQPGPAGADHEGDQRDHRRSCGAKVNLVPFWYDEMAGPTIINQGFVYRGGTRTNRSLTPRLHRDVSSVP